MSIVIPRTAFERAALRYIRHHQALGKSFRLPAWILGRLARFLSEHRAADLNARSFEAWLYSQRHTSGSSRRMHALVARKFCLYRRRSEADCFVPDPLYFPRRPRRSRRSSWARLRSRGFSQRSMPGHPVPHSHCTSPSTGSP